MYLVNGQPISTVAIADRSFQYGDGCFTTILTKQGVVQHWSKHVERVNACLDTLAISRPNWRQVETWIAQVRLSDELAGIKLHFSRGEGGRGYSPTQVGSPNVTISAFAFPRHYEQWCKEGVVLGVCQQTLGINPMLAGHKHNNRLEQILLKAEIERQGFADGIALDCNGKVIETTMANIFWFQGGTLHTPNLSSAGVAGVMRKVVIEQALRMNIDVKESEYEMTTLLAAEEVFITNSILRLAPVTGIGNQTFSIGPITRTIQEKILS
ncbi:aminodeoxychorismate lyase [Vibrio sinaloensis]|uniref:aminodeoxychorismate lyase n=1 Tax=Photobacterium sp. (strain ATCC 43367) TaxID=379097 RepID=UPI0035EDBDCE